MKTIEFNQRDYPELQSQGFASQYAFPFAEKICKGTGLDIGYSKREWAFPNADWGIDNGKYFGPNGEKESKLNALQFPKGWAQFDYIFSSHCLEHIPDWVTALDYWGRMLKKSGIMFLYLPNCDYQEYWRPFHNRKHVNWLTPAMLESYYQARGFKNIFVTQGYDLNASFYAIAEKA